MLETKNPDIDISYLQEKIASEVELQQKRLEKEQMSGSREELKINDPYSWAQLNDTLKVAELNANAGAEVTTMLHHRGIMRKIARFVGKIVIYLGRVITIPQRNFNSSILHL